MHHALDKLEVSISMPDNSSNSLFQNYVKHRVSVLRYIYALMRLIDQCPQRRHSLKIHYQI